MALVAMLFFLLFFPWFGTAMVWQLFKKFPSLVRCFGSFLVGIAPANLFAWEIYQSESGGGSDPDPLGFFWVSFGISCVIAAFTIGMLQFVKVRK